MGCTQHSSSPLLGGLPIAWHCMPFCVISHILSLATLAFLTFPHLHQHLVVQTKLLEHSGLCIPPDCPLISPHAFAAALYLQQGFHWSNTRKLNAVWSMRQHVQPEARLLTQQTSGEAATWYSSDMSSRIAKHLLLSKTLTQGCEACTVAVCSTGCGNASVMCMIDTGISKS